MNLGRSAPAGTSISPKYFTATHRNVTFVHDKALWITAHSMGVENIYYFGSRATPLFKARRMNDTGSLPFTLPPLTHDDALLYMHSSLSYLAPDSADWCHHFFEIATGLTAPVVHHSESPWVQQLNADNVMCFDRVVLTGAFGFVVRCCHLRH